jgi:hypothetical protein
MGCAEQIAKDFSLRFFPGAGSAGKGFCSRGAPQRKIVHGASLVLFLIFCKLLPALIGLAVDPQPVQVIGNTRTYALWPGLTRPSTQRLRHLGIISDLGNIIMALIA